MPIHTVATDKIEYICVIASSLLYKEDLIGCVGIIQGRGTHEHDHLVFIDINNESYVFDIKNIEYITKKEYFKGCLRG